MAYVVRPFRDGDETAIAGIMERAIRTIGPRAYSTEQIAAWAERAFTTERVRKRVDLGALIWIAADKNDTPVAYTLLEQDGHLDHLYCDPDHTRQGLAARLLKEAEQIARTLECPRLFTEASELARPAFERAGYTVTHRRDFTIPYKGREIPIHNFAMEKALS